MHIANISASSHNNALAASALQPNQSATPKIDPYNGDKKYGVIPHAEAMHTQPTPAAFHRWDMKFTGVLALVIIAVSAAMISLMAMQNRAVQSKISAVPTQSIAPVMATPQQAAVQLKIATPASVADTQALLAVIGKN